MTRAHYATRNSGRRAARAAMSASTLPPTQYVKRRGEMHVQRRESDEMACSCGARWPVGEDHP